VRVTATFFLAPSHNRVGRLTRQESRPSPRRKIGQERPFALAVERTHLIRQSLPI